MLIISSENFILTSPTHTELALREIGAFDWERSDEQRGRSKNLWHERAFILGDEEPTEVIYRKLS